MPEIWDIYDKDGNKTGRLHERGKPMQPGDYNLVAHVWIRNSRGEYLLSKRAPMNSIWDNLWQTTGGCAVTGDDGFTTALKEAREEIGVALDPAKGRLFKRYCDERKAEIGGGLTGVWVEVWLFEQEADISAVVLQPEETIDAKWAAPAEIIQAMENGTFIPRRFYPYVDDMFNF
jgi:8-oxo-dGTP pyrophosphatase MutT (NUDIX family)